MFQKSVIAGRESGPWTAGRDGLLGWTFETNGTASLRRLFQKSVRADRGGGPWTEVHDGPLGWTHYDVKSQSFNPGLQYPHLHGPVHTPDNNRWDTPPV